MKDIVITGGAGFLGSRLTQALLDAQDEDRAPVSFDRVISVDLGPSPVQDPRVTSVVGDFTEGEVLAQAVTERTVAICHLAAVLSGGSAADFDLAHRVNVQGTTNLLEAARATGAAPLFVFTSSLAVFGGQLPEQMPEHWGAHPESTYGAFKAIGELLVSEYSRKGWIDGRVCRMPTISVRPGRPNTAASSFASGIIREPLQGMRAPLPVPQDTRLWLCSPRTAVSNLVHALAVPGEAVGAWRVINMPGISVTVAEMLDALEDVAGPEVRELVYEEPDPVAAQIVQSWPSDFEVSRALSLGFQPDRGFRAAVEEFRDSLA